MQIKSITKVGSIENQGEIYKKLIVADPKEELKIFINDNREYYVTRAIRNYSGIVTRYERVSKNYTKLNDAQKLRSHLISINNGEYDYYIYDYLQDDDEYLTQGRQ